MLQIFFYALQSRSWFQQCGHRLVLYRCRLGASNEPLSDSKTMHHRRCLYDDNSRQQCPPSFGDDVHRKKFYRSVEEIEEILLFMHVTTGRE
uniref:Uncharacterized protein n=1 Tax=Parascaris univalens TaxID=6257 RepID=A0A915CEL9_PARUN